MVEIDKKYPNHFSLLLAVIDFVSITYIIRVPFFYGECFIRTY
jgi:hypothetical protein